MDLVAIIPRAHQTPRRVLLVVGLIFALGGGAVMLGHRLATSAVVDLGPTDASYVENFREIERDGGLYFRWSAAPSSRLSLPVRFCGPGSIRLRWRRHFVEPAIVSVSVNGALLGQRSIQARTDHPYEVVIFPVLRVTCTSDASILLEASVDDGRPLGAAIDWVEIRSPSGFAAAPTAILRGAMALALIALAVFGIGGGSAGAFGIAAAMAVLVTTSFASDPVAGERILRGGLVALVVTLAMGFLIARACGLCATSGHARLTLLVVVLATLVSRAAFLHPQAFYPDYRVHALVQQTLHNQGLTTFLDRLFETQYARSLGLQRLHGNWYPFPYPPGSYIATEGVARMFGLGPLDASTVTAIAAGTLIPLLTMAVGLGLGFGEGVAILGALSIALHPLLTRRMALGYFPGLVGQVADAVAVLLLTGLLRSPDVTLGRMCLVALGLAAAFLTYTQSIANFGLMISGLLAIELIRRSPSGGKRALWLSLVAALALCAAVAIFYSRYVPVLENVLSRTAQPESRVLDRLEQIRSGAPEKPEPEEGEDINDPYAATTLNPVRGLARLGARLWRFNGPFAIGVVVGLVLLWRRSDRRTQNIVFAWSSVCVATSVLSAGLPSPNPFQHLKDLEFVTPLFSLALAAFVKRMWERRPLLGALLGLAWLLFASTWFSVELTGRLASPTDLTGSSP